MCAVLELCVTNFANGEEKKSKVVKRKLVTNISKKSSLNRDHDLLCLKVAKEDFGPVGALVYVSCTCTCTQQPV
jgi:hypothetical protein